MFKAEIHHQVFLIGTILLITALPLSPFLVSVGQILLMANWFLQPGLLQRLKLIYTRRSILFVISIYLIHLLWFLNTNNVVYGLHDLKIKLPLLVLPIIYGTSDPINKKELRTIFHFYIVGIFIATVISFAVYFNLTRFKVMDIRDVSPIISHIRLSLLIVLAFYVILHYLLFSVEKTLWPKKIYIFLLVWMMVILLILGATTGIVVFLCLIPFSVYYWFKNEQIRSNKLGILIILALVLCASLIYIAIAYNRFAKRDNIDTARLSLYTANGNKYYNDLKRNEYENQYPIWIQVCEKELEKEWNLRSKIKYVENDMKRQHLKTTLIRYLTSLGYAKDSVGISKLTQKDIEMVENGYTNYLFKNKWSVYPRIYELFWEIEQFSKGGNPGGHSLTQRIEYVQNALHVIKRNFWFGVGTGDVADEIGKQYVMDKSQLNPEWRNRAHNQLITLLLTFGCIGFCLIIVAMIITLIKERKNIDFIFLSFFLIFLISTLNEDTIETQIGATFYAFFFSLLLLGRKLNESSHGPNLFKVKR
jgi:hypothetical protein